MGCHFLLQGLHKVGHNWSDLARRHIPFLRAPPPPLTAVTFFPSFAWKDLQILPVVCLFVWLHFSSPLSRIPWGPALPTAHATLKSAARVLRSTKSYCFPQHRGMSLPLPISLAYQRQKVQTAATSARWCRNSSFKPAGGSQPRYSLRGLLGFTGDRTGWKREMIKSQGVLQWNFLTEAPGWWQNPGERVVPRQVVKLWVWEEVLAG